uniref:Uncharacterized protein n=1 Tax=Lepeophtheirus salmonis TaxID=72036 RepID=A0A0K2VLX4_LEPSM
MWNLLSISVAS